jgi:predicted nucleic acid-binding protein
VISYLGTSLLVKLYVQEAGSEIALGLVRRDDMEPMISRLSEVEMASALLASSGRSVGSVNRDKLRRGYSAFRLQRESGFYQVVEVGDSAFSLAQALGERFGEALGVRALDLLHVATAMRMGAVSFGTFDDRQGRLAEAVGMKLLR